MAHPKPISKEDCIRAMKYTRSVRAAARYLNCSYQHLKPFMKAYKDDETGKFKMIEAGYMLEQCYYCGYDEKRDIDGKTPLLMVFLNGHKHDFTNGNAQLCCYNCYFMQIGNVFTDKDIESIEGHSVYKTSDMVDFQVDEYTKKRLEELGNFDTKVTDNPYDLVSRKK